MTIPDKWRKGARSPRGSIDTSMTGDTGIGKMLTPEQIAAGGDEHAHQAALFQWVNTVWKHPKGHLLFAVPNGGDRQAHVGAAMRAEGVKPGVPDVCWPLRVYTDEDNYVPGFYLELKVPGRERTKNGGLSPAQIRWLTDLRAGGYGTCVAYGWKAAAWALVNHALGDARSTFTAMGSYSGGVMVEPPCDMSIFATPVEAEPNEGWLRAARQWYRDG